jgi:hypothetical protein
VFSKRTLVAICVGIAIGRVPRSQLNSAQRELQNSWRRLPFVTFSNQAQRVPETGADSVHKVSLRRLNAQSAINR